MAETGSKRKPTDGKLQRLSKKQKRSRQYDSASDDEEAGHDFSAVNLLDSDNDDIHNAEVDDAVPSHDDDDDSASSEDDGAKKLRKKISERNSLLKSKDEAASDSEPNDDDEDGTDDSVSEDDGTNQDNTQSKSKRNDPNAFATSLSKILSTKLSTSKRSDPVLARSAAAHEASKAAVDSALETKARKQLRDEKRKAMERGRVRDVLIATRNERTGDPETTTAEILETERRLRKVAQRGVVKLFNAVRAAQVKAVEAERGTRKDGIVGVTRREEKVNEMSKKGFLDLIASGGGGLKKGALEEA